MNTFHFQKHSFVLWISSTTASLIPPVRILIRMHLYFSLVPCALKAVLIPDPTVRAKQYQHVGVWSRKFSCKERNNWDLKPPNSWSSQLSPLLRKGRKVGGAINILVSESLFWRSGLVRGTCSYKSLTNKCYSLFWQNRPRWGGTTPSEVVVLAERRQSLS